MKIKFSLATIKVEDIDASIEFYNGVLGLPISENFDMGGIKIAMLGEDAGTRIELIQTNDDESGDDSEAQLGLGTRYGFVVDDVEPILEKVGEGAYTHPESPNPDFEFYYTHDPDGYLIEIMVPQA